MLMAGWSSYHDQWLSEGLADFPAGLYLQLPKKPKRVFLNAFQDILAAEAISKEI